MPYFKIKEFEEVVDSKGVKIQIGDILENTGTGPYGELGPRYFACYQWDESSEYVEIRDIDHNNVGMCNTGIDGDVITLGNYRNHLDKLNDEDLAYYFTTKRNGQKTDQFRNPYYGWTWKDDISLRYHNLKRKLLWKIRDILGLPQPKAVLIPMIRNIRPDFMVFDIMGSQQLYKSEEDKKDD